MKGTDHHIRHLRGHRGDRASGQETRSCACRDDSIWTRAKHRVGLERPHFCARFRGQSDAWGRSSPTRSVFRCARGHLRTPKMSFYFFLFRDLWSSNGLDCSWTDNQDKTFILGLTMRRGERDMKDAVHHLVHLSVHFTNSGSVPIRRTCSLRSPRFDRGQNTALGWSDPTFAHGSEAKVNRGSLQPNKTLLSLRAARIRTKQVQKVGITHFSFVFTIFFTLGCA